MEKSSKRGKIPQSDWPLIMARYEAGETLASIARTYDCSPPAISYVVSRSRARQPEPEPAPKPTGGPEPQLIKAAAPDSAAAWAATSPAPAVISNGHNRIDAEIATSAHPLDTQLPRGPTPLLVAPNGENGTSHPAAATNGDHRRTLHLSLGHPPHRNGSDLPATTNPEPELPVLVPTGPVPAALSPALSHNGQNASPTRPPNGQATAVLNGGPGMPPSAYPEHLRRNETGPRKDGSAFIDQELRARVDSDIAAFLAAFDAALGHDSQENRAALREATDRLLRAGARTRIELERLEARMPLPPRADGRSADTAWRSR